MIIINKQSGSSLVEILITIGLLTTGLVSLGSFQSVLMKQSALPKQKTEALIIAEQKMEELRNFDAITSGSGVHAYQDIGNGNSTAQGQSTSYAMAWTVTNNNSPDYKLINITVTWTDRQSTNQTIQASSIISNQAPENLGRVIDLPTAPLTYS